ncbi:MAG: peptidylprolyl isomerase [Pseudomonadota bacterium]
MKTHLFAIAAATLALTLPASAQDEPDPRSSSEAVAPTKTPAPSPNQIVDAASQDEWVQIPAEDLLVMTLAPDAEGDERTVVIQLMPAPFSQGWVSNIRTLARAKWYDGITVNRVQDNYVVQWGDPGHDNPESGETETKPLPEGLNVMVEEDYASETPWALRSAAVAASGRRSIFTSGIESWNTSISGRDPYAMYSTLVAGFPVAGWQTPDAGNVWPVHCYGMVGVGRSYSPDTGSGAELYTVIGHAPRHLDRNIALVGRIISGMEHLSSLPRGSGTLGFYTEEEADLRTPILSIRVVSDLIVGDYKERDAVERKYAYEYLSTESESFAKYAEARANRRDPFFIVPAGGADICNIPVPIRQTEFVRYPPLDGE